MTARLVVISGCSGGGKSTLLKELADRHHDIVAEPGRRIVQEELAGQGHALPWADLEGFARRAIAMARKDIDEAKHRHGLVFFDRGLIDAATALAHATGKPEHIDDAAEAGYDRRMFMAPPWLELFASDPERRHDFREACAEYERLGKSYNKLGYDVVLIPKIDVRSRADFVLESFKVAHPSFA